MARRGSVRRDRATLVQLELIRELVNVFRRERIRVWLRGGWGVDFYLGRLTRAHADVDLVTWLRHAARVRALILAIGYAEVPTTAPHLKFRKKGQEVGIVFIESAGKGRVRGVPTDWGWVSGALLQVPRSLDRIASRVVSPRQLLAEKLSYQRNTRRPLRPKDQESIRALREMLRLSGAEGRRSSP